jgi:hypothetical protein
MAWAAERAELYAFALVLMRDLQECDEAAVGHFPAPLSGFRG